MNKAILLTCEHAVNTIPPHFQHHFTPHEVILNSHRGMDFGALHAAQHFQQSLACTLITGQISRLLIDCNRSLSNRRCFSEISSIFSKEEKKELIESYYSPFRDAVNQFIQKHLEHQGVFHLSIHSFTPNLNGHIRQADIGLLYDPKRADEKSLALKYQQLLKQETNFRIRMNYPYRGVSDGCTTWLRKQYAMTHYLGLEIEINQNLLQEPSTFSAALTALERVLKRVY